jgi:hypothetical protein
MKTIFLLLGMATFSFFGLCQPPPDSLIGMYKGTLWRKDGADTVWTIQYWIDTVYITYIDTTNCKTRVNGSVFSYDPILCNLYTEYSYCNNPYNPIMAGIIYPKFYSEDSIIVRIWWPNPPPQVNPHYKKFLGKRIPGTFYVGKNENHWGDELKVCPNPATSSLAVFTGNGKGRVQAAIYNTRGQRVKSVVENEIEPGGAININIQNLPAGLYMARVTINQKVYTAKFIKEE